MRDVAAAANIAPQWTILQPGIACEMPIRDTHGSVLQQIAPAIDAAPIDVNILPTNERRKRLLIADMDSTIIEQECIDELADFAGIKDEIAAITEQAMRGELDFEASLTARVARLSGLHEDTLQTAFRERIKLTPGGRCAVQTMKAHGAICILASGGFTYFTSRIAEAVGFDTHVANELLIENNVLTGEVTRPIFGREGKAVTLADACRKQGIDLTETIAIGDGANDLAMLNKSGLGVAFRAKPAVAAAADVAIHHGDLTALLFLQGYRATDFVS